MPEMYETLQSETQKHHYISVALGIVCLLFIGLLSFTVYYVVAGPSSSSTTTSQTCITAECIDIANQILSSQSSDVEPCDDFFEYVCAGWIDDNSYKLATISEYNQYDKMEEKLKENYLNALFGETSNDIIDHDSVQKAQTFFEACYESTATRESLDSEDLLIDFINIINFNINEDDWNDEILDEFFTTLAWLNQRDWNNLFRMDVFDKGEVVIQQSADFWYFYNTASLNFTSIVYNTFVPLYMDIFNLTEEEAFVAGDNVLQFNDAMYNIQRNTSGYLDPSVLYGKYYNRVNWGNFTFYNPLSSNNQLDLTKIMYRTFDTAEVNYTVFFTPDIDFFNDLSRDGGVLDSAPPSTVKLFLFTNVLWYFLDYENSWQQSTYLNREDFCYFWTRDSFPFVWGYVTSTTTYSDDIYDYMGEMLLHLKYNGMETILNNADYLSSETKQKLTKKARSIRPKLGNPQTLWDGDIVDEFYNKTGDLHSYSFVTNIQIINDFYTDLTLDSYVENVYADIIPSSWPYFFTQSSTYDRWLTGIHTTYYPGPLTPGNWVSIPVTITQEPFFNINYPSAINFGGLGSKCGHELSHGFDEYGFGFTLNGTETNENTFIITDEELNQYVDNLNCFINQYYDIKMNINTPNEFVNGTTTVQENVADNVGLKASYLGWKEFKTTIDENSELPGVDMSDDQLFFWSFTHFWCDAASVYEYDGWNAFYSPNYARVIGALRNSQEFADAYQCDVGSYMNPSTDGKCDVW